MKKILATTLLGISLTACSNISKLERMTSESNGNNFNTLVSKEYLYLAKENKTRGDKKDADYFAYKGLQAAKGLDVYPEDPAQRQINQETQDDLAWAGNRLMALLAPDVKQQYPAETARLQSDFDCWVEQSEENVQASRDCRMEFVNKVSELEYQVFPPQQPVEPEKPKLVEFEEDLIVYFELGKHHLDARSEDTLRQALDLIGGASEYYIRVVGHTDTVASSAFNRKLSRKRTETVADRLVELGADPRFMEEQYFGQDYLVRPTGDETAEKINRRVEINVKGKRPNR